MRETRIEKLSDEALSTCYYRILHKSGLTILVHPMDGYNGVYALFGTRFGSVDRRFRLSGEKDFLTIPDGTAHFLEHKLFEGEQEDAFKSYARTGANANAYTSFDRTCYLFSATNQIEASLEILLNFVTHPYFTDETVQKEQGIIGQEIQMYEDDPSWCVYLNLLKALYWEHPIRIDIAGTVQSIAEITPQVLYRTYHTFYNLGNMALSVAGNIHPEEVVSLCDRLLTPSPEITIERARYEEPQDVYLKKVEKNLEVAAPLFEIGFKEAPENDCLLKSQLESEMLLELLFGESSDFYQTLYREGIINATFGFEVMAGEGYFINILGGEAPDVQKVYDRVLSELQRVRAAGLSKERFEEVRRHFYGKAVAAFNSVESTATSMLSAHFMQADAFEALRTLSSVTCEDLTRRLNRTLCGDTSAISVVNPL